MNTEKVYLFNKGLDKFIFVTSLVILVLLSTFLRVYYNTETVEKTQINNERSI